MTMAVGTSITFVMVTATILITFTDNLSVDRTDLEVQSLGEIRKGKKRWNQGRKKKRRKHCRKYGKIRERQESRGSKGSNQISCLSFYTGAQIAESVTDKTASERLLGSPSCRTDTVPRLPTTPELAEPSLGLCWAACLPPS